MRVGFLSLALIVVAFAGASGNLVSATRVAFAQSQQPRNQQEGLSPEKKSALSRIGPEDVFGVTGDDPSKRQAGRPQRKPTPTPALQSPATQRPAPTSASASSPQPSTSPVQSTTAEPSPTVAAGSLDSAAQQPPLGQGDTTDRLIPRWAAPIGLIAMALIVLALLTFTLSKLYEKIREGSSG
jgi:hypothetical protein